MALEEYSPWGVEINGGTPEHGGSGRGKRLCTGFGNASQQQPEFTFQTPWASNQISPEYSFPEASRYDLSVQAGYNSGPSVDDFGDVLRQGGGNIPSHQCTPSPSSGHTSRRPWLEVVGATCSTDHRVPDVQAPLHPTSNACGSPHLSGSAILCQPTASPNILRGGNPSGRCHQSDVGAIYSHDCQESTPDEVSRLRKSGNSEHKDTSYELCLGLVGQVHLSHEVFGPRAIRCALE